MPTKPYRYITNWYWIKRSYLIDNNLNLNLIKKHLTIIPRVYGDEVAEPMCVYNDSDNEYFGVPIHYGIETFGNAIRDHASKYPKLKAPKTPDPNHPHAPDGQENFIGDLLNECKVNGQFMAVAQTGSGKTVCSLAVSGQLGVVPIVIVPTIDILKQWVNEAIDKLGLAREQIGIVQGETCEYKGKRLVVASKKSLLSRKYEDSFYKHHGMLIVDEVQTINAQETHKVLGLFHAPIQFAVSATPERKDGRDKVAMLWFGEPAVTADMTPQPMLVIPLHYRYDPPLRRNDRNLCIYYMARNKDRNNKIARLLHWLGEDKGRYPLGIGDSIQQIQDVADGLISRGVKPESIGYIVDQLITTKVRAKISLKSKYVIGETSFKELHLKIKCSDFFDDNDDITIRATVKFVSVREFKSRSIAKGLIEKWVKTEGIGEIIDSIDYEQIRVKVTDEEKQRTINDPSVRYVLGSYGSMKMGVSIKRLDCGVDLTPRAEGIQSGGRLRRLLEGKPDPVRQYTIIDQGLPKLMNNINDARMKDYEGLSGVTIDPINNKIMS